MMVWATWTGAALAAPSCTDAADGDFASVGRCLQAKDQPHAALEAWRRAWQAKPGAGPVQMTDTLLAAVTRLAHDTGDDALMVEIARTLPPGSLSDDVRGHVALADGRHDEVPSDSCAYPIARYRLAADLIHQQKWHSAVLAYTEVAAATDPIIEPWSEAIGHLRASALLGAASIYLGLEADRGLQFSQIAHAGAWPDLRGYARAFGTWRMEGGAVRLRLERDAFVPEAAGLLGDAEIERWRTVARDLRVFLSTHADPTDPAARARDGLDPSVSADVGRVWTVAVLSRVFSDLEDERRSAGRDPVVTELLDAREAEVGKRLGAATIAAIRVRLARIDGALVTAEAVRDGTMGVAPVVWSTTDHGE